MLKTVLGAVGAWFGLLTCAGAETLIVRDVTIIDVETGGRRPAHAIVIRNGEISKVGPSADIKTPSDATVIDGRDKFLIPGLWDMRISPGNTVTWQRTTLTWRSIPDRVGNRSTREQRLSSAFPAEQPLPGSHP